MEREAIPRVKRTNPGSKYRQKLVYPNGYVKYVRWPEQLPKEVSNPREMKQVQKLAGDLLKISRLLSYSSAEETPMEDAKTSRERQAADPDFERILRELGQISWSYHDWWHRHDDAIVALIEVKYGKDATQKVREYRRARSAVTTALTDLAGFINEAVEKES
jgi:hypothetical protein